MENRWKKIIPELASDVVGVSGIDQASLDLLKPEMRPETYIEELTKAKKWTDAIKVLSRSLPPREAVWWACVCARQLSTLASDKAEIAALEAAEKWVFKPCDENRLAALQLAQQSAARSAGTLVALGAAFSAGNLPTSEGHHIDMDPAAFPQIVVAAVVVSTSEKKGDQIDELFQRLLKSGEDIAKGGNGQLDGQKG